MAPKGRLLNFTEMQTFLDGAEQFGELVLRCWSYISRYVAERTKGFDNLPRFLFGERCSKIFKATEADCRMMHKVLVEKYPAVVEFAKSEKSTFFNSAEKDAFKPVVIVPPIIFCCKEKIQVRNSVTMAHVYTTQGTTIAEVFHGVCSICGVKYFHSYKEKTITLDEEEKKEWYFYSPANESKYFQISSETFFEKYFLAETSASLKIGACSFKSRCEVYNEVHRAKDNSRLSPLMSCFSRKPQSALRDDCWELNEQRLEEGYFRWSLVSFYEEVSLLHCTNLFCARSKESHRRDIEQLCEKAWVHVCENLQCK